MRDWDDCYGSFPHSLRLAPVRKLDTKVPNIKPRKLLVPIGFGVVDFRNLHKYTIPHGTYAISPKYDCENEYTKSYAISHHYITKLSAMKIIQDITKPPTSDGDLGTPTANCGTPNSMAIISVPWRKFLNHRHYSFYDWVIVL